MSDATKTTAESDQENVAIALAMVIGAGAATGLGAAAVFFPSIVKLASRRVLAGSLGFSAGVMMYVSFIEIFQKAQTAFMDDGYVKGQAYAYSTLCFFGGVSLMMFLNVVVAVLLGGHAHRGQHQSDASENGNDDSIKKEKSSSGHKREQDHGSIASGGLGCCSKDPVGQLEKLQTMASELDESNSQHQKGQETKQQEDVHSRPPSHLELDVDEDFVDNLPLDNMSELGAAPGDNAEQVSVSSSTAAAAVTKLKNNAEEENKRLVAMGMNTAIAIGLHNFPEGLATFVATLHDPKVGAVLALAIAIHNIPEGLCVALPIFYATGKRTNAFFWALLSGASEVVAALLGWAILAGSFSNTIYGILFGLVAGMMVMISVRELLPTAHFYDPQDTVVTYSYIGGSVVMALSLVMFQL